MSIYKPLLFFPLLFLLLSKSQQRAKIPKGSTITATKKSPESAAWTSSSGLFAFGFYAVETKFSIGIWLIVNTTTVIWTFDRDGDLFHEGTQLRLTEDGLQILSTAGDRAVSNITTNGPNLDSAVMQDSGNFAIFNVNNEVMWQTFDYPTDTILVGQLLRRGDRLVSSVSATDHSSGRFQLVMQQDGNLIMYPANTPEVSANAYWSLGSNGVGYTAVIFVGYTFITIRDANATHNNTNHSPSVLYFGTMGPDGLFTTFQANISIMQIQSVSISPYTDECSIKGLCGSNSFCNWNATAGGSVDFDRGEASCVCMPGFVYNDKSKPYMGCNRNISVGQYSSATTEYINTTHLMSSLNNISLIDDSYNNTGFDTEKECSDACLSDSNCYATLFTNNICRKQRYLFLYATRHVGDLGVALFIKVSSGEPQLQPPPLPKEIIYRVPTNKALIRSVVVVLASIFALAVIVFFLYIIINRRSSYQKKCQNMDTLAGGMAPRYFTYRKLVEATKNFTDPLGKGGYSTVFKGEVQLGDGNAINIAVKRLEKLSWENEKGFRVGIFSNNS